MISVRWEPYCHQNGRAAPDFRFQNLSPLILIAKLEALLQNKIKPVPRVARVRRAWGMWPPSPERRLLVAAQITPTAAASLPPPPGRVRYRPGP